MVGSALAVWKGNDLDWDALLANPCPLAEMGPMAACAPQDRQLIGKDGAAKSASMDQVKLWGS